MSGLTSIELHPTTFYLTLSKFHNCHSFSLFLHSDSRLYEHTTASYFGTHQANPINKASEDLKIASSIALGMASLKFAFVVLMCMAVVGAPIASAVTCGQVTSSLTPCLGYLQKGGTPPPACCSGVKSILTAAKTTADRQAVCNCLKTTASKIPKLNPQNAESLPGKCSVSIPYKISTSTNCASIKF